MRTAPLIVGFALLGVWAYAYREKIAGLLQPGTATAGAAGTTTLDATKGGFNFGQVGSNLSITDTRGNALASALATLFASDLGASGFRYVGDDFTLEAAKDPSAAFTVLKRLGAAGSYGYQLAIRRSPRPEMVRDRNLIWYEVVSKKIGFNLYDPNTFIVVPGETGP